VFDTDLEYEDPMAPVIDAEEIVGRAVRVRTRRRLGGGLAVLLALALASLGVTVYPRGVAFDPASGGPAFDRKSPSVPAQPLRIWPGHTGTKTFLYYSQGGQVCAAAIAYDGPPHSGPQTYYSCGLGLTETPSPWVEKPFVLYTHIAGEWICVGLVSGAATKVSMDFNGTRASARVYPVRMPGFGNLGAYVVLLPIGSVTDQDGILRYMTDLVATDAHGHIVTTGS
jgi:hypothetical protein